jgi:hypothetical protein
MSVVPRTWMCVDMPGCARYGHQNAPGAQSVTGQAIQSLVGHPIGDLHDSPAAV